MSRYFVRENPSSKETSVAITVVSSEGMKDMEVMAKTDLTYSVVDSEGSGVFGPFSMLETALNLAAKWELEYGNKA